MHEIYTLIHRFGIYESISYKSKTFFISPRSLLKASTEAVQNMKHAILHFAPLKTAQYNAIMSNHKMHIRLRYG